ncbi:ABC transporter ATP-binding protein [Patescibacteria group bacterium]|nr:MAG: ABC transporter ATP-binding protein [Patescibacteria group bacterium]
MHIISAKKIVKTFHNGVTDQTVLRGVSLDVALGEFVIIIGRSGAGKSTLLYQLGLLDHPTSGSLRIGEVDTENLSSNARTEFRLTELGYIFQDYALVPELTASENIIVPLLMSGFSKKESLILAKDALKKVGIEDKWNNLPSQLSGGEQQRVSVARAIAGKPKIIFADEPTANLDSESSALVVNLFRTLHEEGQTIVMVTHEEEYTQYADRVVTLRDGEIVDIKSK